MQAAQGSYLNCYSVVLQQTLGHYLGDSLTILMLIIAFSTIMTHRPLGAL